MSNSEYNERDFHERLKELVAENERLRDDLDGANECLEMVRDSIEHLGKPMDATPPYSYNDAIVSLVHRRLKEAGVFPGHPATVAYELVEGTEDTYLGVPIEAADPS